MSTSFESSSKRDNLGFPQMIEYNTEPQSCFVKKRYGDMKHLGISGIVTFFQNACQSAEFVKKCKGFESPSFMGNYQLSPGNAALAKFQGALANLDDDAILGLVFHGTPDDNIHSICENGLDQTKRKGQAYGAGEYFSTNPGISISYCRGGNRMLVFVVVMPPVKPDEVTAEDTAFSGRGAFFSGASAAAASTQFGSTTSGPAGAIPNANAPFLFGQPTTSNNGTHQFASHFNSTMMGSVFAAANNTIRTTIPSFTFGASTNGASDNTGNNTATAASTFPSAALNAALSQAVLTSAQSSTNAPPSSAANIQQNQMQTLNSLNSGRAGRQHQQRRHQLRAVARCPPEYVIVNDNNHQLPIGTLTFKKVDDNVMANSLQLQAQLISLNKQVEDRIKASEEAQLKAEIIQLLIAMKVDEASEMYIENRDTLSELTKKEISWYVQSAVGNDGRFLVFFPDLPKPMNNTEISQVMVQSVDHAMLHETQARHQLARTQKILAKKEEEEDKNDGWGSDFKRKNPPKDPSGLPKKPREAASITADIMRHLSSKRMDVASELYMQRGSLLDGFAKREISQCVHRCCDDPSLVPVLFPDLPVPDATGKQCGLV